MGTNISMPFEPQIVRLQEALAEEASISDCVTGDVGILQDLEGLAASLGFPVRYDAPEILAGGVDPERGLLCVDCRLDEATRCYVLAHELTHAMGCRPETDSEYGRTEIVADMTAALVCGVLGLDAYAATADYVSFWQVSAKVDPSSLIDQSRLWAERLLEALAGVKCGTQTWGLG